MGSGKWDTSGLQLQQDATKIIESNISYHVNKDITGIAFPLVDIIETQSEIVIIAELPGFDKDMVELHIENNILTIAGNKDSIKSSKNYSMPNYYRIERTHGKFSRSFAITHPIDEQNIKASMNNGLLEITLQKH